MPTNQRRFSRLSNPFHERNTMGHIIHHAIIATTYDSINADNLLQFCKSKNCSVSLVEASVNRYYTVFVGTDGSKSGWSESDDGDRIRSEIKNKIKSFDFEDGSNPFEWMEVSYSSDDQCSVIVDSRWKPKNNKTPTITEQEYRDEQKRLKTIIKNLMHSLDIASAQLINDHNSYQILLKSFKKSSTQARAEIENDKEE